MIKKHSRRDFLYYAGKIGVAGTSAYALTSILQGCVGGDIASTVSQVAQYSDSIVKSGKAAMKAAENFTPEQEYYIGRTVGAVVLDKYKPYSNTTVNNYVNTLGQTLAQASDLPETFNGYHMLILDSEDINAFATPAGHIFLTRGMLDCCRNEGELAAVLAHEIGHVQMKHGMDAIDMSRYAKLGAVIFTEGTKVYAENDLAAIVSTFDDSIDDIITTMVNKGYSRSSESEADESAVTIMQRVGYNPVSLIDMLEVMDTRLKPEGLDFAKTHPSPKSRIEYITGIISSSNKPVFSDVQKKRFQKAMKNV